MATCSWFAPKLLPFTCREGIAHRRRFDDELCLLAAGLHRQHVSNVRLALDGGRVDEPEPRPRAMEGNARAAAEALLECRRHELRRRPGPDDRPVALWTAAGIDHLTFDINREPRRAGVVVGKRRGEAHPGHARAGTEEDVAQFVDGFELPKHLNRPVHRAGAPRPRML